MVKNKKLIIAISLGLMVGCSQNNQKMKKEKDVALDETVVVEQNSSTDSNSENEEFSQDFAQEPAQINRPVITLKYDPVVIDAEYHLSNPSYNINSVIDIEDGEITEADVWYGGLNGSEELINTYKRTTTEPYDHSTFVPSGRKMILAVTLPASEDERIGRIIAYDSDGYVSWKDFQIIDIPDMEERNIGTCHVLVEGLRVRSNPSVAGETVGYAWQDAQYRVYEIFEGDDYTWYRIGDGMWFADDGTWVDMQFSTGISQSTYCFSSF